MPTSFINVALSRRERNQFIDTLGASTAVIVTDVDGAILATNARCDSLLSVSAGSLVGKPMSSLLSKEGRGAHDKRVKTDLLAGRTSDAPSRFRSRNGDVDVIARYFPVFASQNQLSRIIVFLHPSAEGADANSRKSAIANAVTSTHLMAEMIPDGTLVEANGAFASAMNCPREKAVGQKYGSFVDGDDHAPIWRDVVSGTPRTGLFKHKTAEGRAVWLAATYAPVATEDGKVAKIVMVATDQTRAVEEQHAAKAKKQQVDGLLGRIAATISDANERAVTASSASSQTAQIVRQAAEALDEFEDTARQIADAMNRSKTAVGNVATETRAADNHIAELSQAADSMSSIVEIIQKVAGQINMLALNATIESARAGEAGRGFAVVAAEVKSLADQVEKSTNQITDDIARIQTVSNRVVGGLRGIGDAVRSVEASVQTAGDAMEKQTSATREIAGNMKLAASSVGEVDHNLSLIGAAVGEANREMHDDAVASGVATRTPGAHAKASPHREGVRSVH